MPTKTERIRELNDKCRATFTGCIVMLTVSVQELEAEEKAKLLNAVRTFNAFNGDNDPHQEHDFGHIDLFGTISLFWVFSYFDKTMSYGSDDASDARITTRVLPPIMPLVGTERLRCQNDFPHASVTAYRNGFSAPLSANEWRSGKKRNAAHVRNAQWAR